MTVKLRTPSNGSVTLSPQDTASDVVLTVPARSTTVLAGSGFNLSASAPANTFVTSSNGHIVFGNGGVFTNTPGTGFTFNQNGVIGSIGIGHGFGTTSGNTYLHFCYDTVSIGTITQNGTTGVSYNTSSDYRLKENIQPMQNALATVAQLNPVTYTWKIDGSDGQGFIAHELQAVVPDAVTGEKDAVDAEGKPIYQGVDTSFLVATLTKAIQEQQAIINSLQDRITALENA